MTDFDTRAQELVAERLASIRQQAIRRGLRVPAGSGFSYRVVAVPSTPSAEKARAEMSKPKRRFVQ